MALRALDPTLLAGGELTEGEHLVGRAHDCRIHLDDARVSRHHALLEVRGDRVEARDLESRNGLFVNGARVRQAVLGAGDRVAFGPLEFVLEPSDPATTEESTQILERGRLGTETLPTDAGRLQLLHTAAEKLVGSLDREELLRVVLDCLEGAFSYDRCAIAGRDAEGRIVSWASRPERAAEAFSHSIAGRVLDRGEALLFDDIQGQTPFALGESVLSLRIRSVLCSPLVFGGAVQGLVYLDRSIPGAYDLEDLALLRSICVLLAIALENARLHGDLRERYAGAEAGLREAEAKLIEAERAAALGELALAVAHEVRNPVMVIGGMSRRLERRSSDPEAVHGLEIIREEAERLERMMARVEALISLPAAALERVPLAPTLTAVMAQEGPLFARREIALGLVGPSSFEREGEGIAHDPALTRVALSAVLEHASQSVPSGGAVVVSLRKGDGGWAVDVADARCAEPREVPREGIAPEPWSLDLGLALADRAMAAQGGELLLGGQPDAGIWVRLAFPPARESGPRPLASFSR